MIKEDMLLFVSIFDDMFAHNSDGTQCNVEGGVYCVPSSKDASFDSSFCF